MVLLVLIPKPVKQAPLLLDLPLRLLILENARLDSTVQTTQEDFLESFRGTPNLKPPSKFVIVSALPSIIIWS